jgi:hypothetical protein
MSGGSKLRRSLTVWLPVAIVLALLALVLTPKGGADSSTLSRQSGGWWALWSYAQARGVEVRRLDRPLDELLLEPGAGPADPTLDRSVLVLSFPWQVRQGLGESKAVERFLRAGGTVLATYRFAQFTDPEPVWRVLGTEGVESLRPPPPLGPRAWWRYRGERWALAPTSELPRGPRLELPAFHGAPTAPTSARVLYAAGDWARNPGTPLIWIHPRFKGRVVVLPSDLLSNAELRRSANADLVETLFTYLEGPWIFDEFHHGLIDPAMAASGGRAFHWDLFLLHLGLLYLLGVWTLGRGFGASWREPVRHHGSSSLFLRSLGLLHHRLGHHREAAAKLLERTLAFRPEHGPGAVAAEDLRQEADSVDDAESLVRFARRLVAGRSKT